MNRRARSRRAPSGKNGIGVMALSLVTLAPLARGEIVPTPTPADHRVRTATYDADQVYRLHGVVGYQIDLEFESGESFVGLGAGDIEGIAFFGQDNHLFIKPKAAPVATNLTVLTNRRRYLIDYSAFADREIGDARLMYAIRFIYPTRESDQAARDASQRIDRALDGAALKASNVDYWYCGAPSLRPIAASDDGVHTRLRFAPTAELPAVFVRAADGSESLLNFSVDDGDLIIHRVAQRFILRRGRLTGCIVNQGYAGAGLRLRSGTVTPEVERTVPGSHP
jgi:type IV secretion system protein VirB9